MDGPLKPVFEIFDCDPQIISDEAGRFLSDFNAQITWRFNDITCFPKKWAHYTHPASSGPAARRALVEQFFELKQCCRGPEFDEKIFQYFGGNRCAASAVEALLSSKHFDDLITLYVLSFKCTNMIMERLLGWCRKACLSDHSDVERVICRASWPRSWRRTTATTLGAFQGSSSLNRVCLYAVQRRQN